MKISELAGLLAKVQNIAGDVEIVLKDASSEAETVITDLAIHLNPSDGATGGSLTVEHGPAPAPAAAEATEDAAAADEPSA